MSNLILKTVPNFPSKVYGSGFITITKANGNWTISFDASNLVNTPSFDTVGLLTYDPSSGTYSATQATVFARSLLDDPDAATARATLGVGIARTITGTANEITVVNGDGVSGNPTLSLPAALTFTSKTVTGGTFSNLVRISITGSGAGDLLTIGGTTANGTATPDAINLGGDFSTTPGANPKIKLLSASGVIYGFGVSNGLLEAMSPSGAGHAWYVNGSTTAAMTLSSAGALSLSGAITAASFTGSLAAATGLPISTGVSGLATGIAAFLATPSSSNLRAALTDETGTGLAYFQGGDLGTPSAGVGTNLTGTASGLTAGNVAFTSFSAAAAAADADTFPVNQGSRKS
jgi:hypothetical protein